MPTATSAVATRGTGLPPVYGAGRLRRPPCNEDNRSEAVRSRAGRCNGGSGRRVRGIGRTASLDSPYQLPARIQFASISARATIPSARATIPARNNAALGLLVSDRRVSIATIEVALFRAVRPMAPNVTAGPMAIPVAGSVVVGRMRVFVAGNLINIPFFSRRLRK
jgi:hypothetical protein